MADLSRRSFLKAVGLGGAAIALGPTVALLPASAAGETVPIYFSHDMTAYDGPWRWVLPMQERLTLELGDRLLSGGVVYECVEVGWSSGSEPSW